MLIRMVRMHFTAAGAEEFLEIFHQHKTQIRNFPGCHHLQLLQDVKDVYCYTTLSHWDGEASLENYRKSELFEGVWSRVKKLFARRTEAFSMVQVMEVASTPTP
jgi:heme-degrading monooxygenase HmoA